MSATTGLQLRSLIKKSGELELSLVELPIPEPAADQVVVKVEATPINPSDLGLLIGPADMSTAQASGSGAGIKVTARVPEQALPFIAARLDQAMPVGNEGAGTVIKAGSSEAAQALLGKTVSAVGGSMYSQYRLLEAAHCQPVPAGTTAAEGASGLRDPLTRLGAGGRSGRGGPAARPGRGPQAVAGSAGTSAGSPRETTVASIRSRVSSSARRSRSMRSRSSGRISLNSSMWRNLERSRASR